MTNSRLNDGVNKMVLWKREAEGNTVKVSQRTEYGLRAMVAIAMEAGEERPVPLSVIAESEAIPEQFLDQIVMRLRKAGFVKSVRGVNGGYLLARPATEISVGQLVRLLEGTTAPMGCISDEYESPADFCGRFKSCHTRSVWVRVMDAVDKVLDGLSLKDVMDQEQLSRLAR